MTTIELPKENNIAKVSLFAGLAACAAMLASFTAMATEEPAFHVLERDGAFELREYPAYVVAETRVEAGFTEAGNVAFQRLFGYISGENAAREKIAMTAPVTAAPDAARGEKIAMTAPVSQVADGAAYVVAFTLPAKYTLQTAPTPRDPNVHLRAVPSHLVACWRYSGRWTESNYRDNESLLRAQVGKRELEIRGEPILARYDPPFMPWFLRRNEVWIPVERSRR